MVLVLVLDEGMLLNYHHHRSAVRLKFFIGLDATFNISVSFYVEREREKMMLTLGKIYALFTQPLLWGGG